MPTLLEISGDLAKMFVQTKNKKYAVKRVIDHINTLQYSDTKQPIDYSVKMAIVQVMNEVVNGTRPFPSYDEKFEVGTKEIAALQKCNDKILQMLWEYEHNGKSERQTEWSEPQVSLPAFNFYKAAGNGDIESFIKTKK